MLCYHVEKFHICLGTIVMLNPLIKRKEKVSFFSNNDISLLIIQEFVLQNKQFKFLISSKMLQPCYNTCHVIFRYIVKNQVNKFQLRVNDVRSHGVCPVLSVKFIWSWVNGFLCAKTPYLSKPCYIIVP